MRDISRAALTIGLFLLVLSPVLAASSFTTELVTLQDTILPGDSAVFELWITNTGEQKDRYSISSNEFSYILFIDPRPEEVEPMESAKYGIEISPRSFVNEGAHKVPLSIRSLETKELEQIQAIILIRDPDRAPIAHTPSIALSVDAPDEIDPRDNIILNIALRNRNPRVYDKEDPVNVYISSDIFERSYTTSLGGVGLEGEKANEIRIDIDPHQPPGEHPLKVQAIVQNETVTEKSMLFTIEPYESIEINDFHDVSLFKSITTYKVLNDGNINDTARIEYPINALKRLFVTSSHNFEIINDDALKVIVEVDLEPLGEETVTITENYRLLVLLIVLVFASLIGYYLLRSPLVLDKEATLTGSPEDGVNEIKVRVLVKNRSSKTMRHLRVIDKISGMADIIKEESLGTLKPTKVVKKEGQGTLLRWDIDQLEPFEERIISYRAKTPLKLVGDVSLPAVKVKFDVPSGRERTSHSNEVSIARPEQ